MANITNSSPVVTEDKLKDFYEDIKPFLGCPAYVTQEGDAEYYSTDEKVIGRWIDGKPLYQKTFKIGALTNYTSDWTQTTNIAIGASVDEFVCSYGVLYSTNKEWCASIPYSVNNNIFVIPSLFPNAAPSNSNTVCLAYLGNLGWVTDSYITVQYTKTTDSAVTTTEQKPTHYSTDEQVVGTWIDGKPLYQKTVYMEASYLDASTDGVKQTNKKAHNINNIKNIISCDAKLMFNLSGDKSGSSNLPFLAGVTIINDDPVPLNVLAWADKTNICIDTSVSNMSTWNDSVYFTLQYVKTTD